MTTVCVLCDPPRPGLVLPEIAEETPLSEAEAAGLYGAMLKDVCRAVEGSGGDLLVNYRPDDALPGATGADVADQLRSIVSSTLTEPAEARYEPQVGESLSGRVGNSLSFLLGQEEVHTAAAVTPTAAFLGRQHVDEAAMKLRRSEVVLGPTGGGRVYYAGFADTIDFAEAYTPPAVGTLTDRGLDAGHDVDYLPDLPVVETGTDLADALTRLRAREAAGRVVPRETAEFLDGLGLSVAVEDGRPVVVR